MIKGRACIPHLTILSGNVAKDAARDRFAFVRDTFAKPRHLQCKQKYSGAKRSAGSSGAPDGFFH